MLEIDNETSPNDTPAAKGSVVFILIYTHRHGEDFGVYSSHTAAEAGVWELMEESRSDFDENATEGQVTFFQKARDEDNLGVAVRAWSAVLSEEGFEIHKRCVESNEPRPKKSKKVPVPAPAI
jgi:hypothetical protein